METVSFDLAKKLKEKGFSLDEPYAMYNEQGDLHKLYTSAGYANYYDFDDFDERDYIAPTISQILKWLREEKKIYVSVEVEREDWFEYKIVQTIKNTRKSGRRVYETYSEAILAGIEYVLDNLI